MSSVNKGNFIFSFQSGCPFFLSQLCSLESPVQHWIETSLFVPDVRGKVFSLLPLSMMVTNVFVGALYQIGEVPFIPSAPEFFSEIDGQFCQMIFLY